MKKLDTLFPRVESEQVQRLAACLLVLNKLFLVTSDRPLSPNSEYLYSRARQATIAQMHHKLPMNRNSSGTSELLFIYRAESEIFMQKTGFLLQNFTFACQTLADISFELN
ncbi:MAG: hypothetical protein JGK12_21940 [Microcoleus sp. PH2017_01_SCD_O_A]|uniref:hypothetical protein n=1 Tax=Microcoleus sp. PH2017_01_SCD_O_A TaxID=2798812 RepID=UPI001D2E5042|nr:hypothetical protein [Microcoleus sp. PH2017_01_SCD_O_A]MCC3426498.1 hypothetical protein [Microcoleus sp. PH2017_01_SCD_O_A]TAG61242.1 MAG: hypothetical protein EAZ25_31775 [Oscillatoriales cyanobacterium]